MEIVIVALCVLAAWRMGEDVDHPVLGFFIGLLLGPIGVFIMFVWWLLRRDHRY